MLLPQVISNAQESIKSLEFHPARFFPEHELYNSNGTSNHMTFLEIQKNTS